MKVIYLLLAAFYWSVAFFNPLHGQGLRLIRPSETDPRIDQGEDQHYVFIPQTVQKKDRLFLFFPGTGAIPASYDLLLRKAAEFGYHSIGLTYPNDQAINSVCLTTFDGTCHGRARREILDGIDRHEAIAVDPVNAIENRVLKLLRFLHNEYPVENWDNFFTGNEIAWNKIIVAGHSQGGGHAGFIGKLHRVERVVMFASLDWVGLLNRPADWIAEPGATPAHQYYGFIHEKDEALSFEKQQTTWEALGMTDFGPLTLVDATIPPYEHSRTLYTQAAPRLNPSKYHAAPAASFFTPRDDQQEPLFAPVWKYMMEGGGAVTPTLEQDRRSFPLAVYPNPFSAGIQWEGTFDKAWSYKIFNARGKLLQTGQLNELDNRISTENLPAGAIFLQISNDEGVQQAIKLIKQGQ